MSRFLFAKNKVFKWTLSEAENIHFKERLPAVHFFAAHSKGSFYFCTDDSKNILNLLKIALEGLNENVSVKILTSDIFESELQKIQEQLHNHDLKNCKFLTKIIVNDGKLECYFDTKSGKIRFDEEADKKRDKIIKKRVLVIDDSKVIRTLLKEIFMTDERLNVVGECENPVNAEKMIQELKPDVITLDINMPHIDGVTLLKTVIIPKFSTPTLMFSSISKDESSHVFDALESGAVDYIHKPSFEELKFMKDLICEKVYMASLVNVKRMISRRHASISTVQFSGSFDSKTVWALGASTGGTEALREVLLRLPENVPPIVIVQHIPPVFSTSFAERLNEECKFEVREAKDGDDLKSGLCLIAPGGMQMKVYESSTGFKVKVWDGEPVNRHKPSVDVLFDSLVDFKKIKRVAGILTGMGSDGAKGLLNLKKSGAFTCAQDENTSVVYGMPRVAAEIGAADKIVPLDRVADFLVTETIKNQKKAA